MPANVGEEADLRSHSGVADCHAEALCMLEESALRASDACAQLNVVWPRPDSVTALSACGPSLAAVASETLYHRDAEHADYRQVPTKRLGLAVDRHTQIQLLQPTVLAAWQPQQACVVLVHWGEPRCSAQPPAAMALCGALAYGVRRLCVDQQSPAAPLALCRDTHGKQAKIHASDFVHVQIAQPGTVVALGATRDAQPWQPSRNDGSILPSAPAGRGRCGCAYVWRSMPFEQNALTIASDGGVHRRSAALHALPAFEAPIATARHDPAPLTVPCAPELPDDPEAGVFPCWPRQCYRPSADACAIDGDIVAVASGTFGRVSAEQPCLPARLLTLHGIGEPTVNPLRSGYHADPEPAGTEVVATTAVFASGRRLLVGWVVDSSMTVAVYAVEVHLDQIYAHALHIIDDNVCGVVSLSLAAHDSVCILSQQLEGACLPQGGVDKGKAPLHACRVEQTFALFLGTPGCLVEPRLYTVASSRSSTPAAAAKHVHATSICGGVVTHPASMLGCSERHECPARCMHGVRFVSEWALLRAMDKVREQQLAGVEDVDVGDVD